MDDRQVLLDFAARYESKSPTLPSLSRDPAALSNAQLLTAVLGLKQEGLSGMLCDRFQGLRSLLSVHPRDLEELGLTRANRRQLLALFELVRRFAEEEWPVGSVFRGSADIYGHFRERLAAERQEHFIAVLLDNKHRKLRDVVVSLGSLTSSVVHPRDVFRRVIRDAAAAVLFVHNHPSGDPTPSREDIDITRRLREVGELIGVRVLDHIIIGAGSYISFVDDGYW